MSFCIREIIVISVDKKKKVNKNVAINLQTTKECKMSDVEKFPKNTYACKDVFTFYILYKYDIKCRFSGVFSPMVLK